MNFSFLGQGISSGYLRGTLEIFFCKLSFLGQGMSSRYLKGGIGKIKI